MKKAIFLYHSIGNVANDCNGIAVSSNNFIEHIEYLKSKYLILSIEELMQYRGEKRAVAISFDDGYQDFYSEVFPIIKEKQVPVTLFVSTGIIAENTELWTTELAQLILGEFSVKSIEISIRNQNYRFSMIDPYERMAVYSFLRFLCMGLTNNERQGVMKMLEESFKKRCGHSMKGISREQLKELSESEHITIGAHTVSHPSLGMISQDECNYEIEKSIEQLGSIIDRKIRLFAYPYGRKNDFNENVKTSLMNNGIEYAFTVDDKLIEKDDLYEIPRIFVDDICVEDFKVLVNGIFGENIRLKTNRNYVGVMYRDYSIRVSNKKIIIWGTGQNSDVVFEHLTKLGKDKCIVGYIDSNSHLWGDYKNGYLVRPIEEYDLNSEYDLIIKNSKAWEIIQNNCFSNCWNIHVWL